MNRRTMLKWVCGTFGAAALTRIVGAGEAAVPWKTAIGLNGFMSSAGEYGHQFRLEDILDFARRTGFDGVELVQGWPAGDYPRPDETEAIAALKKLYADHGLQIFSLQLGVAEAFAPDPAVRRQWLATFRQRATVAQQLGCDCVGMWPGGPLGDQTIDQAIDHLAESFRAAGRIAGDLGLLAAFEIEPPFVFCTEDHLKRILEQIDTPHLKTIFDPSHFDLMSGSRGKPHEMLQRIGVQHIGYVHLTDCDGTIFRGTSRHFPCGDGHVDIDAALDTLKQGGFTGWIMIDAWMIEDPYDACVKGKRAIERARAR